MGGMPGMGMMGMLGGEAGTMGDESSSGATSELVVQAVKDLPPGVAADPRGFLLRCAVPGPFAGSLLNKGGSVQEMTNTKITIPGKPEETTRVMSIEGPLLNVCAAYMLMMVRYIEVETESKNSAEDQ